MTYWLVNQSVRQRIEGHKQRIFAPFVDAAGRTRPGYDNMAELRAGDVVLAFSKGLINAVGRVVTGSTKVGARSELPDECPEEQEVSGRHDPGWEAEVNFVPLTNPIRVADIDERLRTPRHGPFTAGTKRRGTMLQGQYLMPVSKQLASEVHKLSGGGWPADRSPT